MLSNRIIICIVTKIRWNSSWKHQIFFPFYGFFYSNLLQHWLWYIPGDDTIEAVSVTSVSSFLSTLACCSSSWSSWWLSKLAFSVSIFDGVVASTPPLYRSLWWFGTDGLRTTCQKIKKNVFEKCVSFHGKKDLFLRFSNITIT